MRGSFWSKARTRRVLAAAALGAASAMAASAADSPEEVPPPSTADVARCAADDEACGDAFELDVVEVSARRRDESLMEVPISVSVLSGRELRERGASDFKDYASAVPGLSFTAGIGFGGDKQVIRGISFGSGFDEATPFTQLMFGETPLAGYRNLYGLSFGVDPQLVDIDRIEVLRGPQGTLFGATSMGGTIRIIPNAPDVRAWEGSVSSSISTTERGGFGYNLEGVVNVPLTEGKSAIRAVGFKGEQPGWIDNTALDEEDVNASELVGGRVAVRFEDGALRTDLSAAFQERRSDGHRIDEFADPRYEQTRRVAEPEHDRWTLLNATVDFTGEDLRVVSSTSYFDRASGWTFDVSDIYMTLPGFPAAADRTGQRDQDENKEFTQEIRVQSLDDGALDWLVGVFYQHRQYGFDFDYPSPGFDAASGGLAAAAGHPDNLGVFASDTTHDQMALFFDATWQLARGVEVEVGNRWFRHRESFQQFSEGTAFAFGPPRFVTLGYAESAATPRASVSWRPSGASMYYLSAAEGFSPGASNAQEGEAPACAAELASRGYSEVPDGFSSTDLVSYEFGSKLNLGGGTVLNAAVYRIEMSNLPEVVQLLSCGAAFLVNGDGTALSKGAEIELSAQPFAPLELGFSGSYQDTRFVQTDTRVSGVPWYTAALSLTWAYSGMGFVRLDWTHVDEAAEDFSAGTMFPAYDVTSLSVVHAVGAWTLFGRLENVFDEYSVVGIHDAWLGRWHSTLPPRTVTFGVSKQF